RRSIRPIQANPWPKQRPKLLLYSLKRNIRHIRNLFPPCETWGNNYNGLLKGGHISNYLIPQKEDGEEVPKGPYVPLRGDARLITERSELGKIAETVSNAGSPVALGLKTCGNGLSPWRGDIRLLCLGIPDHPAWLLDLRAIRYDLGDLGQCLQERQVIVHDAKFDLLWLRHKCGLKLDNVFCTFTASHLLTNGKQELRNDLYACLERFLGLSPGTDHGKSDWGVMFLAEDQLEYAALVVLHLHRLKDKQLEAITAERLERVLALENRLIPVVVEMENRGFSVNGERLLGVMGDYSAKLQEALAHFKETFGEEINPNSPKQLKEALAKKGLGLTNTSEQTLKQSGHRLARCILNYRSAKKQMEQAETILKAIETDGRIHARFEPTGTNTGRFSCKKPNLQNIGRGKIRTCFVPGDDNRLVVADYSQVELRIAAAIAGEERMIEAYEQGSDLHRQTASIVLGKPVEDISKEDRQLAKAVNFGLLYGQSAKGLVVYAETSYGVKLDIEQARQIRRKFFDEYKHLREWHSQAEKGASSSCEVLSTKLGRKRWLPMEGDVRWQRFTALLNAPVQGGAADVIKTAIVDLQAKLPEDTGLVSTVHDELIVEVPLKNAEAVKKLMEDVMIESAVSLYPTVPFEVEAHICEDWSEK
ncbi:DNA polymerase, partial [bacterium]|nr:DNA polymerase [bacterium]